MNRNFVLDQDGDSPMDDSSRIPLLRGERTNVQDVVRTKRSRIDSTAPMSTNPVPPDLSPASTVQNSSSTSTDRKYQIRYTSEDEAPFQVVVEVDPSVKSITTATFYLAMAKIFDQHLDRSKKEVASKTGDRQLTLEFATMERANNFIESVSLEDIKASAFIPPAFVEICGVVPVDTSITDEDLPRLVVPLDPNYKITKLRRFEKRVEGVKIPLPEVAIYFQSKSLPDKVLVGPILFSVKPYKSRPLICRRCWWAGHSEKHCRRRNPACAHCAEDHSMKDCPLLQPPSDPEAVLEPSIPRCISCKGNHTANSPLCPKYQQEVARAEANPFPRLHRTSLLKPQPPPQTSLHYPALSNRFACLSPTEQELEEDFEPAQALPSAPGCPRTQPSISRSSTRSGLNTSSSHWGPLPRQSAWTNKPIPTTVRNPSLLTRIHQVQDELRRGPPVSSTQTLISTIVSTIIKEVLEDIVQTVLRTLPTLITEVVNAVHGKQP